MIAKRFIRTTSVTQKWVKPLLRRNPLTKQRDIFTRALDAFHRNMCFTFILQTECVYLPYFAKNFNLKN